MDDDAKACACVVKYLFRGGDAALVILKKQPTSSLKIFSVHISSLISHIDTAMLLLRVKI